MKRLLKLPLAILEVRPFNPVDHAGVIAPSRRCGFVRAWNDPARDIAET